MFLESKEKNMVFFGGEAGLLATSILNPLQIHKQSQRHLRKGIVKMPAAVIY